MKIDDVADQLTARLDTIPNLRALKGARGSVSPPMGFVVLPDMITFSRTYNRGSDQLSWPILILAGKTDDSTAIDRIGMYCDGEGAHSVKEVMETGTYTAFDSIFVESASLDVIEWAGINYQGALFQLNIFGVGREP